MRGRVQGVGFRHFATVEARRRGVSGFVRNEPDGSVTVVAEGPKHVLVELLEALRNGPPSARVQDAVVAWHEASGEFSGFGVKWS